MNIYKREIKTNLKSLIIWTIAIIAMIAMEMQEFNSMTADGAKGMMDFVDKMPSFIKAIWGISSLNITEAIGYFGVLFLYISLMSAIHASMLGANIIAKEERDKTTEFLMAKPVSRNKIITMKLLSALTNIIILNVITFTAAFFILKEYTSDNVLKEILLCMAAMLFLQTLFMVIGAGIALIMKNPKKAGSITMGILVSTFILSLIIDISKIFKVLIILSPFKYFEAKRFLTSGNLDIGYIILSLIICLVILFIGYKSYNKRDLNM